MRIRFNNSPRLIVALGGEKNSVGMNLYSKSLLFKITRIQFSILSLPIPLIAALLPALLLRVAVFTFAASG